MPENREQRTESRIKEQNLKIIINRNRSQRKKFLELKSNTEKSDVCSLTSVLCSLVRKGGKVR